MFSQEFVPISRSCGLRYISAMSKHLNETTLRIEEATADKQHIIWDWNGTLLDDVPHAVKTINHFLEKHGLEQLDHERYRNIFRFPIFDYYQALGFDFKKAPFESLCHQYVDR